MRLFRAFSLARGSHSSRSTAAAFRTSCLRGTRSIATAVNAKRTRVAADFDHHSVRLPCGAVAFVSTAQDSASQDSSAEQSSFARGLRIDIGGPVRLSSLLEECRVATAPFHLEFRQPQRLIQLGAVWVKGERCVHDVIVAGEGSSVVVFTAPKLFPAASKVDWSSCVVHDCEDFVVVNKPAGVPTNFLLDNVVETAEYQLSRLLGQQLTVVHRLDVVTRGLLVYAKNTAFASSFQQGLNKRRVRKVYRTVVSRPQPVGLLEHWTTPSGVRAPIPFLSKVDADAASSDDSDVSFNWRHCALNVRACSPAAHSVTGDADVDASLYELEIELLTGRTHQIRGQLGAVGNAVLNDRIYGWDASTSVSTRLSSSAREKFGTSIALQSFLLEFEWRSEHFAFERPPEW